ncbi:hypothetical protein D3C73_1268250 [compost metagenome]
MEDPKLRERLGKNALEVSKAFNKTRWKERWKAVIQDTLGDMGVNTNKETDGSAVEVVELRLGAEARKEEWLPEAIRCLQEGKAVFVRGNEEIQQQASFGRMQWISNEAELCGQFNVKIFG